MKDERTCFEGLCTSPGNRTLLQSSVVTIEVRLVTAVTYLHVAHHWHANRGHNFSDVITDPGMLMARVGALYLPMGWGQQLPILINGAIILTSLPERGHGNVHTHSADLIQGHSVPAGNPVF
jgi:hypothetical protein